MSMTSVGDTLLVTFDFPEDKLEQHLQNDIWIRVRSEGWNCGCLRRYKRLW